MVAFVAAPLLLAISYFIITTLKKWSGEVMRRVDLQDLNIECVSQCYFWSFGLLYALGTMDHTYTVYKYIMHIIHTTHVLISHDGTGDWCNATRYIFWGGCEGAGTTAYVACLDCNHWESAKPNQANNLSLSISFELVVVVLVICKFGMTLTVI